MVSLHSDRTLTKTEAGTREQGRVAAGLTMLLIGRMWALRLWIRKVV